MSLLRSDLLRGEIHLAAFELDAPCLLLERRVDNSLNLGDLLAASGGGEGAGPEVRQESKFTGQIVIDRVAVSDVAVTSEDNSAGQEAKDGVEELITLPQIEAEKILVDCKQRQIRLAALKTSDGMLRIRRRRDGSFLWQELVPTASQGGRLLKQRTMLPVGESISLTWQSRAMGCSGMISPPLNRPRLRSLILPCRWTTSPPSPPLPPISLWP